MLADKRAKQLGYSVVQGEYHGTTDDRADRWYLQNDREHSVDRRGKGFATKQEALDSLEESLALRGDL